jgi:hypothetical protein
MSLGESTLVRFPGDFETDANNGRGVPWTWPAQHLQNRRDS